MVYLTRLSLHTITEQHIFWLATMTQGAYFGDTATSVLERASRGLVQLWGCQGDRGIAVTELVRHVGGLEVFLCGFAGEGIAAHTRSIFADLCEFSHDVGAKWLGGDIRNEKVAKLVARIGVKFISTRMTMEV